jgi:hypothetical protein
MWDYMWMYRKLNKLSMSAFTLVRTQTHLVPYLYDYAKESKARQGKVMIYLDTYPAHLM